MWLTIGAGGCRNELLASPLLGPLAQLSFVLESVPLAGLSFVLESSTNDTLHILVNPLGVRFIWKFSSHGIAADLTTSTVRSDLHRALRRWFTASLYLGGMPR